MTAVVGTETSKTLMGYIAQMDHRLGDRSKREYTNRLRELSRKIPGGTETLTAELLIQQIQSEVTNNTIAASTFRMYKSAVMYWLGQQAQAVIADGGDPSEYARAYDSLRGVQYLHMASANERTSSRKLKYFSDECLKALLNYAQTQGHRAPNAVRAAAFAKANLLVGLRPSEWFDVRFASYLARTETGEPIRTSNGLAVFEHMMIVENAKATHGRGNGQQRELILHSITPDELKDLMHFAEIARRHKERHPPSTDASKLNNLFFRPMNNMIRRALTAAGYAQRDIPSIYSTRHQVVADFKASGYDKRKIAAFFGHSSEKTQREHYGQKKHGGGGVRFQPSIESLAKVSVRSVTNAPETIRPGLATEAEQWAAERDNRKPPSRG
jgi:integrase